LLIDHAPDAHTLTILQGVRDLAGESAADDRFNEAQDHFVQRLVETASIEYFHFDAMTPRDGIVRSSESADCLNCGRYSITNRIIHEGIPEHLVIHLCPRCSSFFEGYPAREFEVKLQGAESIRADEDFEIDLVLTNTGGQPKNMSVGGTLRFGNFYQAKPGPTTTRTIHAGDSLTHTFTGMIPSSAPPNDLHSFHIFCLVDGRISILAKPLWRTSPEMAS
jgi:hypothetical protein